MNEIRLFSTNPHTENVRVAFFFLLQFDPSDVTSCQNITLTKVKGLSFEKSEQKILSERSI